MKKIFSILLLWLGITLGFAQTLITQDNTDGVTGSGSKAQISQYTAKGISITWDANDSKYAFDSQEITKLPKDQYPSVKNADGTAVLVPYKAVINGKDDLITAKITITNQEILKDAKIEFKVLSSGKNIEAVQSGNDYKLKLKGAYDYAEEEIVAALVPNDKEKKQQIISSFRLVHLSPKDINVSFVPLDKEAQNKLDDYGNKVNSTYQKVGVNFNVRKEQIPEGFDSLNIGDRIESGDPKLMSTYGSDQLKINSLYKGTDQRYVVFVTSKQASTGADGYFRLNGQFGYVFGKAKNKTAAHELGHGVFKLEHPWEAYGTTQGATPLLMDYSQGEILSHLDWKQINDPKFKIYAFQSQSSGEAIDKNFVLEEDGYFITPSNKLIKLPKGTEVSFYCDPPQRYQNNVLHGFKTTDGFYWDNSTQYHLNQKIFDGYYKVKKDKSDWEKDKDGNRILFKDTNYKYNGANKYPVYYILWVNLGSGKSEYRIQKGEIDVQNSLISTNQYFSGAIADVSGTSGLSQVNIISSTDCHQTVQEKGELYQTITNPEGKYEVKVLKNKDGKLSVEFKLLTPSKKGLSEDDKAKIEAQTQILMNEKLQEIGSLEGSEKGFKDNFGFYVADMTGKQWLTTIGDLGTSVWENAALPKTYWNQDEAGYTNSSIRTPALFAGVADGGIDMVSDYPQLIKLGYEVSTKKEVREGIWNSIKEISPASVKTMATDAIKQKIDNYNFTDKPYLGYHELGKDGVTVVSAVMGAGFLKAGDKALENATKTTGEKIKEAIEKKGKDLEKDMAEDWFKKRISDAFNRYKKRITENLSDAELQELQTAYEQRYKTLYKNREIGKITEKTFQELEGGAPKTFKFQGEVRRVDNVLGTTAKEIKSGRLKGSEFINNQLRKDLMILGLDEVPINKVEWHLFGGADKNIIEKLEVLRNTFGKDKFDFIIY